MPSDAKDPKRKNKIEPIDIPAQEKANDTNDKNKKQMKIKGKINKQSMHSLFKNVSVVFICMLLLVLVTTSSVLGGAKPKPPIDNRESEPGYIPKEGFVPNDTTAIKIAEAVWVAIYGEDVYKKKPYKVKLKNGIWIVEGTLPRNYQGGVPYILIQKKDGKILKVMHGK